MTLHDRADWQMCPDSLGFHEVESSNWCCRVIKAKMILFSKITPQWHRNYESKHLNNLADKKYSIKIPRPSTEICLLKLIFMHIKVCTIQPDFWKSPHFSHAFREFRSKYIFMIHKIWGQDLWRQDIIQFYVICNCCTWTSENPI